MLVDAHVLTAGYVGFSHRDVRIDGDLRTKLLLFLDISEQMDVCSLVF